jgi:hypothetical protein
LRILFPGHIRDEEDLNKIYAQLFEAESDSCLGLGIGKVSPDPFEVGSSDGPALFQQQECHPAEDYTHQPGAAFREKTKKLLKSPDERKEKEI